MSAIIYSFFLNGNLLIFTKVKLKSLALNINLCNNFLGVSIPFGEIRKVIFIWTPYSLAIMHTPLNYTPRTNGL